MILVMDQSQRFQIRYFTAVALFCNQVTTSTNRPTSNIYKDDYFEFLFGF